MKKIIYLLLLTFSTTIFSQNFFNQFENREDVSSIVVSKKMFEMMSKVKVDSNHTSTKQYIELLKKLDNLRVFSTTNVATGNKIKQATASYLKENPLEELMRINDLDKKVTIYVKEGASKNNVTELLMLITSTETTLLSLTGNFNINEIGALTEKMNLPGKKELEQASKK